MTWAAFIEFAAKHWLTVAFGLIVTTGAAAYRRLSLRIKKNREREGALEAGLEALLADRLIQLRNYYSDKGYCPTYARSSADAMYEAYHGLGGNGTITDVFEHLKKLPLDKKKED